MTEQPDRKPQDYADWIGDHSGDDPDDIRQQRLDDAWQFPDDDRDDGYEPPRRLICIDQTGARSREDF